MVYRLRRSVFHQVFLNISIIHVTLKRHLQHIRLPYYPKRVKFRLKYSVVCLQKFISYMSVLRNCINI